MTPDIILDTVALGVLAFLLTYLLHSTLLLGGVWAVTKLGWVRRAGTEDTLWKLGLVGGLVTASLVTLTGFTPLAGRLSLTDVGIAAPLGAGVLVSADQNDATSANNQDPSGLPRLEIPAVHYADLVLGGRLALSTAVL